MNELGNTPADKDYQPSGISRAEEAAMKTYPVSKDEHSGNDINKPRRMAFTRGYEQAEKDLGWISVKDKLPGPSEWVLACIEQYGHAQYLTLAIYSEETKEWHTDQWMNGKQETYYPDYWMPIPNKVKIAE